MMMTSTMLLLLTLASPQARDASDPPQAPALDASRAAVPMEPVSKDAAEAPKAEEVPDFAAGRPGFTEARGVVGAGVVQFEGGFSLGRNDGLWSLVTPGGALRVGLNKRVELRATSDGYLKAWTNPSSTSVVSDTMIGVKVLVFDQKHAGFELDVLPSIALPTGTGDHTTTGYEPGVKLAVGGAAPFGLELTGTAGWNWTSHDEAGLALWSASASAGHVVAKGWIASAEMVLLAPRAATATWTIGTAMAHMVGANVQVDIQAGRSVVGSAGWYTGAGIVVRRP
jgi:Putative MetA-pathway of phenol degradation